MQGPTIVSFKVITDTSSGSGLFPGKDSRLLKIQERKQLKHKSSSVPNYCTNWEARTSDKARKHLRYDSFFWSPFTL